MDKLTIIYIAGYGRSGSTLLERILSSHEKIVGVGELSIFLTLTDCEDFLCSCGEKFVQCSFWSSMIKLVGDVCRNSGENRRLQLRFESLPAIWNYFRRHSLNEKSRYKHFNQRIMDGIHQNTPAGVEYIVDSSKTTPRRIFRPIALSKIASLNVKVIHIVRDGRGCLWSLLKGSNRKLERGENPDICFAAFRGTISWFISNIAAHLFQFVHSRDYYFRLKYEDLLEDSCETLKKLGDFLELDLTRQAERIGKEKGFPVIHQIGGNRIRFSKEIILKKDVQWKPNLKTKYKLFFWFINWPLMLIYNRK